MLAQPLIGWVIATNLVGGALALACAAIFSLRARLVWAPRLVSFAIGAMLGAAFLVIFPACLQLTSNVEGMISTIMLGIVFFFVLEKLLIWRHHHHQHHHEHHDRPGAGEPWRTARLVLLGNTVHHLLDGVMIAAAFSVRPELGVIVAGTIFIHATAQHMGDYCVLVDHGLSGSRAVAVSGAAIAALVPSSALALAGFSAAPGFVPYALALSAASLIYVAVADLIPGLQARLRLRDTLEQVGLIGLGVGAVWLLGRSLT